MVRARVLPVGPVRGAVLGWRFGGHQNLTIVAKASFDIGPDGLVLAAVPDALVERDEHHEQSPTRSLRHASDLAPYLTGGEVLFVGAVHGAPGATVRARLAVLRGEQPLVDKTLEARLPPSAPSIAVTYEHARGGAGVPANPVGMAEPHLLDPRDPRQPIGLGPVARGWRARAELVPAPLRRALLARVLDIGEGIAWEYFHAAPRDQRAPQPFEPGDRLVLEHLSREPIDVVLPRCRAAARLLTANGERPVTLVADTLQIDGERRRVTVLWRGHTTVDELDARHVVALGLSIDEAPIAWPEVTLGDGPGEPDEAHETGGAAPLRLDALNAPSLPFQPSSRPASAAPASPASSSRPWREAGVMPVSAPKLGQDHTFGGGPPGHDLTTDAVDGAALRAAIPFPRGPEAAPSSNAPRAPLPGAPWAPAAPPSSAAQPQAAAAPMGAPPEATPAGVSPWARGERAPASAPLPPTRMATPSAASASSQPVPEVPSSVWLRPGRGTDLILAVFGAPTTERRPPR